MGKLTVRAFLIYWLPALLMLVIISVESTDTFSGAHTGRMLHHLLRLFSIQVAEKHLELMNGLLRKMGHVAGYGFLSFLIFRACRGTYRVLAGYYDWRTSRIEGLPARETFSFLWQLPWALLAMGGTVLAASADELHQMTIPSRTGTWWDVLLDSCAGLAAQILIFFFATRKDRLARQRQLAMRNAEVEALRRR